MRRRAHRMSFCKTVAVELIPEHYPVDIVDITL